MKGQPIPLQIPRQGQQRNAPPHLVGPEAVVDGQNMVLTVDGRYGCRPGYVRFGNTGLTEPPLGSFFFRDSGSSPRYIMAGATAWATYNSATDAWTDITPGGDPLTGDATTPVRFTTFLQTAKVWVLGTNNVDTIKRWEPTLAEYTEIAASPAARDITVLANRVVVVNTVESGVRYAARVKWSAAADATTWPALGFVDLAGAGEELIGIERLSRTTAALYRTNSIWLLNAQPGGDATAFVPEQVSTGEAGPISPAAIVPVGRSHYYIGRDGKVYQFGGVDPVVISEPINLLLDDTIDPAYWSTAHGVYYARRREIWWWVTKKGESSPQSAFVFDLDGQRWEVEQRFSIGVTASVQAEDARTGAWDSDDATWDSDESTWDDAEGGPELLVLLGTSDNRALTFGRVTNDDGNAISFSWTLPIVYAGQSSKLLVDEVEHYFKAVEADGDEPSITVQVYGYQQPLGARELLYSGAIDVTSAARLISEAGDTAQFDTTNYRPGLQVAYSGSALNNQDVEWGGGVLIVYEETDG